MDLFHLLSCLAGFVFFALLYLRIINPNNKNRNLLLPPVADGALPIIGHIPILNSQKQILSRTLGDMADKHGPLFMVRSGMTPIAMICGLEAAKDCFTTHERDVASKPEFAVGEHLGYNYAMFSFSSDNAYWRVMRKFVVSELLSSVKLDKVKHIRLSELETSIKELYLYVTASPAAVVAMDEWLGQLTLNTSCRIVAGRRYKFKVGGAVGDDDSAEYKEAQNMIKVFREFQYLSALFVLQDAFPIRLFKWFDFQGHVRAMKRNNKKVDKILQAWIDEHVERRQRGNAPAPAAGDDQDLIDLMLSTIDKEFLKGLPHTHQMAIKGTTQSMIIDGSDTTATHMTWVLSLLVKYSDVMKRCREEIAAQVGSERWVEDSDVKKLEYLQAVVKESLRLYPSVPLLTPRMTSKDCKIGGYDLPKGTQFNVNLWKIMRDPKFWADADKFMPERFLNREEAAAEADNTLKRFQYVPFGCGRRICVGMAYALQISHLTIARLIQGFDFSTPGNVELDMEEGLGVTLPRATPLQLVVTPRLPSNFYGL